MKPKKWMGKVMLGLFVTFLFVVYVGSIVVEHGVMDAVAAVLVLIGSVLFLITCSSIITKGED